MPQTTPTAAKVLTAAETKAVRTTDFGLVVLRKEDKKETQKAEKRKIERICQNQVREIVDVSGLNGLKLALAEGRLTEKVFNVAHKSDWRQEIRKLLKQDVSSEVLFEVADLDMKCLYCISQIGGKSSSGAAQMRYLSTVKSVEGRGL